MAYGTYAEIGYDVFASFKEMKSRQLIAFVRYEKLDLNAAISDNGVFDPTLNQQHIITGLNFNPTHNVAVKADVRFAKTGEQNPDLITAPNAVATYQEKNIFFNLGVGFSF